jgi:hypothetical protein
VIAQDAGAAAMRSRRIGWLATATGVAILVSVASLLAFFAVGGPFGAINDWTVGLVGVLTALLALGLRRQANRGIALSAVAGGLIVVLGATLVVSDRTGFLLAGLVESVGFALVGVWLVAVNRGPAQAPQLGIRLRRLGIVAGIVMMFGLVGIPGVVMRIDDQATAPGWVWIGFIGWLGIFFLYPAWSLWIGSLVRDGAPRDVGRT